MRINKAIVTGASGFVGSALCKELVSNGIRVIAVARNENSDVSTIRGLDNVNIVLCELANISELPSIICEGNIDVFFHFAWDGTSGPLRADELLQIENIKHCCEAVRASKELGCKRFVYAASIMEYEIIDVMNKNVEPLPNEIYSTAKLCADYMGKVISTDLGIEYVGGIISNIFGPGEVSNRLVNYSLRKILEGKHVSFSNGTQMYDFIYIDDAAKAFYEIGMNGIPGKNYYVGSLNPRPLKEFLISMKDQVDPSIELGLGEIPSRSTSLTYKEFDTEALKHDTGFEPTVSFEEGIRRTIAWLKETNSVGI